MGIHEKQIDHVYCPHALAIAGAMTVGIPSEAKLFYAQAVNLLCRNEVVGILTKICAKRQL